MTPEKKKIAIVMDAISARRLVESMFSHFKPDRLLWLLDAQRPVPELVGQLQRWQPDGIILRVLPELDQQVRRMGKPMVICGGNRAEAFVSSVVSDSRIVGQLAARHLLDLGLRSLGFVGMDAPFSLQRERGFEEALRREGVGHASFTDRSVAWHHYMEMPHSPDPALLAWLDGLPKPAGVFAAHDPLGWHLSHVCLQARIAVPDELAIIGANNDEVVCRLSVPPLSSVALPWRRIGAEAALEMDRLLELQDTGETVAGRLVRLQPEGVVTRQSTDMLAIENPSLRKAVAFIKAHASEPITVADVCRQLSVSRRKLELDFARQLRRTPKEEITRVRIERAKLLLAETELAVPLVGERCGFNYPERFTIAFRRSVGLTPMAFRRSMRSRPGGPRDSGYGPVSGGTL